MITVGAHGVPAGYVDRVLAGVEALGRGAARQLEFGYLDDDVPVDQARWWATATWKGIKLSVEDHAGPADAIEALVHRVYEGATCVRCGRTVTMDVDAAGDACRRRRVGAHYVRGCDDSHEPISQPNRAQRRRQAKARSLR